jgi:hypothetical protein
MRTASIDHIQSFFFYPHHLKVWETKAKINKGGLHQSKVLLYGKENNQ